MKQIIIFILSIIILNNIMKKEHFESSLAIINLNSVFNSDNIISNKSVSKNIKTDNIKINNLIGEKINIESNISSNTINTSEINIEELCDSQNNCLKIDDLRKYKEFSLLDSNDNKQSLNLSKIYKFKDTVSNVSKMNGLDDPFIGELEFINKNGDKMKYKVYEGSAILKKGYTDNMEIESIISFIFNQNYPNFDKYKIYGYSSIILDNINGRGLAFMIEYDNGTKITYYSHDVTDSSTINEIKSHTTTGETNNSGMNVIMIKTI